jgi:hypothetical protein
VDIDTGNTSVFTRHTDPFQLKRVQRVLDEVEIGSDLSHEERGIVSRFLAEWADVFALSLGEVKTVPGAVHTLDIPPDAVFRTKVHQRPLSPPQKEYFHGKLDEMLAAGVIEHARTPQPHQVRIPHHTGQENPQRRRAVARRATTQVNDLCVV